MGQTWVRTEKAHSLYYRQADITCTPETAQREQWLAARARNFGSLAATTRRSTRSRSRALHDRRKSPTRRFEFSVASPGITIIPSLPS